MAVPLLALLLVLALDLRPSAAAAEDAAVQPRECVVLLHGLGRSGLSMKALEWRLEDAGYGVVNLSYPSLSYAIEDLAPLAVEEGAELCRVQGLMRINFVTHSLGGILVRQYMAAASLKGLHRVVMLGPPNGGSQVAEYYSNIEALRPLEPQAIMQLGTGENSVPQRLGPVSFELGVIAGASRQSNLLPGFPDVPSDGTVALTETVVDGMKDFIQLPTSHTFMMWNTQVLEQVVHFLRFGQFDHGGRDQDPAAQDAVPG